MWYLNFLPGMAAVILSLFNIPHACLGWILSSYTLLAKDIGQMKKQSEIECGLLIPANVTAIAFFILSFFLAKPGCLWNYLLEGSRWFTALIILAAGFLCRAALSAFYAKKNS